MGFAIHEIHLKLWSFFQFLIDIKTRNYALSNEEFGDSPILLQDNSSLKV
jgi:hypothetical protein